MLARMDVIFCGYPPNVTIYRAYEKSQLSPQDFSFTIVPAIPILPIRLEILRKVFSGLHNGNPMSGFLFQEQKNLSMILRHFQEECLRTMQDQLIPPASFLKRR